MSVIQQCLLSAPDIQTGTGFVGMNILRTHCTNGIFSITIIFISIPYWKLFAWVFGGLASLYIYTVCPHK